VRVPYQRGLVIFLVTVGVIAVHHRIEALLGLEQNTVLMAAPLAIAGVLMVWRRQRAKHYIEVEVDWWELLFFMMLFAKAGALEHTGVAARVAADFATTFQGVPGLLLPVILGISAIGSAFVDNVVFVAAFVPVVRELHATPLWWALLFGACLGGNMTMIGSAANIIAIGVLEKRHRRRVHFMQWLKVGVVVALVTCLVAWAGLSLLAPHMPEWRVGHGGVRDQVSGVRSQGSGGLALAVGAVGKKGDQQNNGEDSGDFLVDAGKPPEQDVVGVDPACYRRQGSQ
jgi:Na+/H+ antiporter NhaD/arsenite permease-like protein